MRARRGTLAVFAVLGALGAVARAPAPPVAGARAAPGYVALGDSFAAGPGIPDPTGGTCARSTRNYPSLVAARLHLDLTDVTCSGATTANVLDTPQDGNPPQLAALGRSTRYVTLTIGNNDVSYTRSSVSCGFAAGSGATCLDRVAIDAAMARLEADLVRTLRAVRRAAPRAHVLLVAYPRTLPTGGAPCPPQNPMSASDSQFLERVGARLQHHLVAAARTTGVTFVDTYRPAGHDVCSPEGRRWIEGAAPESPALIWHPNQRGMEAQAARVGRAVEILDKTTGK